MKHRIIPAILLGGAGTRLWPISSDAAPRQFQTITGSSSLFTQTVRRVSGEAGVLSFAPPIVLANSAHSQLLNAQLGLPPAPRFAVARLRRCAPRGARGLRFFLDAAAFAAVPSLPR